MALPLKSELQAVKRKNRALKRKRKKAGPEKRKRLLTLLYLRVKHLQQRETQKI
jgi:hypothetical protein